jgi:thioester reductase-like protein
LKIKDFFRGKKILLTGCTGFVGKVMLEKCLRSFPDIGCIFMLVREKRNKTKNQRIREILESQCFNRLKEIYGEDEFKKFASEKVIPVNGDLIIEGLGMSEEDR